ncbi:MAG TPA: hypothetical protein IGS52_01425 [Oscillatoriaceae cyanobacterium M33_DOE_052]|uniref:Uncharacterized protein n=1 Tax=Planktothricoides sp. SpSt-374 TaxID=2282167 RepID=A0A7C3VHV4_9CYAN|nr:hypothetical protein [Oscillatoriaceae cyanobacterium M33_DOE_052]
MMRNAPTAGNTVPPTGQTYSPSIPISVYREVVAELQSAKATLETLQQQNQQLAQQNQQLRQEMENAIKGAVRMQQILDSFADAETDNYPNTPMDFAATGRGNPATVPFASPFTMAQPNSPQRSEPLFAEEEAPRYRRPVAALSRSSDIEGIRLVLTVLLIVAVAFGVGSFLVAPLFQRLQNNTNQ